MWHYKCIEIYDIDILIDMTLGYILVYYKCLSVLSAVYFKDNKTNNEIIDKDT